MLWDTYSNSFIYLYKAIKEQVGGKEEEMLLRGQKWYILLLCSMQYYRIENVKAIKLSLQIDQKHEAKYNSNVSLNKQGPHKQCKRYKEC